MRSILAILLFFHVLATVPFLVILLWLQTDWPTTVDKIADICGTAAGFKPEQKEGT